MTLLEFVVVLVLDGKSIPLVTPVSKPLSTLRWDSMASSFPAWITTTKAGG